MAARSAPAMAKEPSTSGEPNNADFPFSVTFLAYSASGFRIVEREEFLSRLNASGNSRSFVMFFTLRLIFIAASIFGTVSEMNRIYAASFIPLGDLPGGSFSSRANGVSDDGSVIVGGGVGANGPEGFRWTVAGGIQPLGSMLIGPIVAAEATAVSSDGMFIAGFEANSGIVRSYRWTNGTGLVNLGALAGGGNLVVASAVDVFGDVYGTSDSSAGNRAFRWRGTDSNIFEVGSVPGGFSSSGVTDVGYSGTVETVGFVSSGLIPQAAKISPSPITILGDLPGGIVQSVANGVSNNGVVVGYGSTTAGEEAFRYTQFGGMVSLGDLPGGPVESGATDVSNDGSVIVGYGTTAVGQEAFVYGRSGSSMEHLQELLIDRLGAPALQGWRLTSANGISGNGRVVVGDGVDRGVAAQSSMGRQRRQYLGERRELGEQLRALDWRCD